MVCCENAITCTNGLTRAQLSFQIPKLTGGHIQRIHELLDIEKIENPRRYRKNGDADKPDAEMAEADEMMVGHGDSEMTEVIKQEEPIDHSEDTVI